MTINCRTFTVLLAAAAIAFAVSKCSKKEPMAFVQVHSAQWMQARSADFHGKNVAILAIKYCAECHGANYRGGESGVSCYSCHGGGPSGHPTDWMSQTDQRFHGKKVEQEGWMSCAACHGDDYKGGTSEKSCFLCHNGPSGHPDNWDDPQASTFHGRTVAQKGPTSCRACHGSDYKGGISAKSCFECHSGPGGHPLNWLSPQATDFHGNAVAENGLIPCQICHGGDLRGGTSGESCYECHASPGGHASGWMSPQSAEFHGKAVAQQGPASCQDCHGADYRGGTSEKSCFECHDGPGGHPVDWLTSLAPDFHGNAVAVNGPAICQACHGSDYQGGTSGKSCYECHNGPGGHTVGWMSPEAPDFHGKAVIQSGSTDCQACHGYDYRGGTSERSCFECHNGPSGHPIDWMRQEASDFHGNTVAQSGPTSCQACHGVHYEGGTSGKSCYECHYGPGGHTVGWMSLGATDFHGKAVAQNGPIGCQVCHGSDYRGGTSGKSCYECHAGAGGHPAGWVDINSSDFHGIALRAGGWVMAECQECHGADYAGGTSGASCITCHVETPEACNTCHGSAANSAPPEDTQGNTATTYRGVGAHQAHVGEGTLWIGGGCSECHEVPHTYSDTGHIDSDLPAEVVFGSLSNANGALTPVWDGISSCDDVYCHGEFRGGNRDNRPEWTLVGSGQGTCGTCHGLPPGELHPLMTATYVTPPWLIRLTIL